MYRATYAGFNTSLDFCEDPSKFYSRVVVSQSGSFPPWTICHRVPDRLSHPQILPSPFREDLDAPKASRGASLSASKFMNRRRLLLLPSNPAIRTINASVPRLNFALEAWKMSPSSLVRESWTRDTNDRESVQSLDTLGNTLAYGSSDWFRENIRANIFRNLDRLISRSCTSDSLKIVGFHNLEMRNKSSNNFLSKFSYGSTVLENEILNLRFVLYFKRCFPNFCTSLF